jgi:antirestriction protein
VNSKPHKKGEYKMEHRIYVASLSDYNNGVLHGVWIDLEFTSEKEIMEQIEKMLADSPYAKKYGEEAEEWAVHDYEGVEIEGENPDLEKLLEQVQIREEVGDTAWEGYVDMVGSFYATKSGFEDAYRGVWKSKEEYAEEFFENVYSFGDVPEILKNYFDWEACARDLFITDFYAYQVGYDKVYVYSRS